MMHRHTHTHAPKPRSRWLAHLASSPGPQARKKGPGTHYMHMRCFLCIRSVNHTKTRGEFDLWPQASLSQLLSALVMDKRTGLISNGSVLGNGRKQCRSRHWFSENTFQWFTEIYDIPVHFGVCADSVHHALSSPKRAWGRCFHSPNFVGVGPLMYRFCIGESKGERERERKREPEICTLWNT